MTLLFASITSVGAWADYSTETVNEIQSADDWNALAEYVAAGNNCSGMTFKLMDDISISQPLGRQTGSGKESRKRFAGTFDGNGMTLTITMNTTDQYWQYEKGYCSPFAYTQGVTIKDLHVTGTVTTTGTWASGLVGSGEGHTTIQNCQVSVAITANYVSSGSKYGNHGGFIGIAEGGATISDSWFDGKFLGKDYQYSAGFIGMNKGATTLSNCLFNPSEINIDNNNILGSCEFVHDINGGSHNTFDSNSRVYWVTHFGEPENAQGQRVVTLNDLPGEINQSNFGNCVSSLPAADGVTYYIVIHSPTWMQVQELMANGQSPDLSSSIKAGSEDDALVVPNGVTLTIHQDDNQDVTIDRDLMLAEAKADGYVIKVEQGGTLIINGGTITGGHNTGDGGGIYNAGTLTINGATIKDNFITQGNGGGIYNAGTLTVNGATITGNLSKNVNSKGVGVYVAEGGSISIKGNVQIKDNIYKNQTPQIVTEANNLYLTNAMTISGSISGSSISVQASSEGDFTSGLQNNGTIEVFSTDKDYFEISLNDNTNEAKLTENLLELANGTANTDNISSFAGKVARVVLTGRSFVKNNNWNTLCLPFDLKSFTDTPLSGATVMKFDTGNSGFADGTLTLKFIKVTSIDAGKPYIVMWNKNVDNPEFVGVKVSGTDAMTITSGGSGDVSFVGSYDPVSIESEEGDKTMLYMGAGNTLYYPNGTMTIGACRAYFKLNNGIKAGEPGSSGVRSIVLNFHEEATGIVSVSMEEGSKGVASGWYSLDGKKLYKQPTTKGLYIQNGRKVIVN